MKIKYIVGCLLIILLSLYGCDSMEENYEQYLEEYNYSGKITNLRVYPGYERVVLAWDNPKDQKSKSILIIYGPDLSLIHIFLTGTANFIAISKERKASCYSR